jgi:hypothetical protein
MAAKDEAAKTVKDNGAIKRTLAGLIQKNNADL